MMNLESLLIKNTQIKKKKKKNFEKAKRLPKGKQIFLISFGSKRFPEGKQTQRKECPFKLAWVAKLFGHLPIQISTPKQMLQRLALA